MISYLKASPVAIVMGLVAGLMAMTAMPGLMDFGREQYERLRPVITDWKVTESRIEADDLIVHGTMKKTRDCLLVPPAVARDVEGNAYLLESEAAWRPKDSSSELQPWGPWRVHGWTGQRLKFLMVYLCAGNTPTVIAVGSYPK